MVTALVMADGTTLHEQYHFSATFSCMDLRSCHIRNFNYIWSVFSPFYEVDPISNN